MDKTRILFVGDIDQLPSIGPGNVLSDIISSNTFGVRFCLSAHLHKNKEKVLFISGNHSREICKK